MKNWTSELIQKATQAEVISEPQKDFLRIQTDSRKVMPGDFFVALKGEAFDGHAFVSSCIDKGAAGVLVHEWNPQWDIFTSKVSFYKVADTLKGLQDLAHFYRHEMKTWLAAITGSNGKTSTKEFAAALIKPYRNVHWSQGSFNNHWGVPFTLLDLKEEHQLGLVEMGMNHFGEITTLMNIAEPNCVVCTMVGKAHIEHFGSIEAIAKAKAEIYESAGPGTIGIFNLDNPWTLQMKNKYASKLKSILTFSQENKNADIYLKVKSQTLDELCIEGHIQGLQGEKNLALFGVQNVVNLSAAVGIALSAGLTAEQIWNSLGECKSYWGRNQKIKLASGASVLFDAYNANPDSMTALIENVHALSGFQRKIGFFAQMLELGEHSAKEHQALAEKASQAGYDELYFYGPDHLAFKKGLEQAQFKGIAKIYEDFKQDWVENLKGHFKVGDFMSFKASRGMKMERVVATLDPTLNFSKN